MSIADTIEAMHRRISSVTPDFLGIETENCDATAERLATPLAAKPNPLLCITQPHPNDPFNALPSQNEPASVDCLSIRDEVHPEYCQRFEDAFVVEANEFTESVLKEKPVPLPIEGGMMALQHALLTGEVVKFNEKGERL
ncbi:hypothetical protein N0V84_007449 [Fusarium piperis]|uniref:Uncharacterized protein n=1 Tax=Fusarium piperis TaxID=1435070 RepID=A0A9W8W9X4_9HYPO|nr:hypothetical protein N0V84_007449 [Fusarium piperis]